MTTTQIALLCNVLLSCRIVGSDIVLQLLLLAMALGAIQCVLSLVEHTHKPFRWLSDNVSGSPELMMRPSGQDNAAGLHRACSRVSLVIYEWIESSTGRLRQVHFGQWDTNDIFNYQLSTFVFVFQQLSQMTNQP